MKPITIFTRDIGAVRDRKCSGEAVVTFEDRCEKWIKRNLGVEGTW